MENQPLQFGTPQLGNVTLEQVCAEQGEPYIAVSPGNKDLMRTLKTFRGDVEVPYRETAMYCGRVRDAVIFGRSYVTHKPGSGVFMGQSPRDYEAQEFADYYASEITMEQRPRPQIAEECCFLGGMTGTDKFFGHFIFEFLYRLPAFERAGLLQHLPVVVHEEIPDEWISFIELYGVPRERIIRVPRMPAAQYKSVWVTPCPFVNIVETYAFWDDGVHDVRRKLFAKTSGTGPEKVFLGRLGAKHRRVVNEGQLWAALKARGFVYPDFTGLTASEQIRLVKSAKVIVNVFGSGTIMTHFAPENCAIIDLCPPHLAGGFGALGGAAVIGQIFGRIPTEVVKDKTKRKMDFDMKVDVPLISKVVDEELRRQGI